MALKLPNVTLVGIDCVSVERIQKALDISSDQIEFASVKLLTSLGTSDPRKIEIPHLGSVEDYSAFVIRDLHRYIETEHVLIVQYDGFVLNHTAWEGSFLAYDYIGSPWLVADWSVRNFGFPENLLGTRVVGNGGFSLRSKKLLETSARLAQEEMFDTYQPEDVAICVWHRQRFEDEGICFAPVDVAARFSMEGDGDRDGGEDVYTNEFGFHGFRWTDILDWTRANPQWGIENVHVSKKRYSATI